MMFLVPAIGVPSELILQDTLKSAIVALGVLGAALVFFYTLHRRDAELRWHGLVWLPLALMAYALGSMLWSHAYLAGVEAIRWFVLALLFWLGLNVLSLNNVRTLFWGIHAGAVVASVWAVLQFWLDFDWFPQIYGPAATFINRNFFAEYLVGTLPFSVYLLASMHRPLWSYVVAGSLALNVVALLMTGTRSALVAMMVLGPVLGAVLYQCREHFAWAHWRKVDRWIVALLLVGGIAGLGSIPSSSEKVLQENRGATALQRSFMRAASMADSAEYTSRTFHARSVMWKATARMIGTHPWVGVGAGAWEVHIPLHQRVDTTMETDYYAHNEFLQILSEYGLLVGGLVLAFLLAYVARSAWTCWHSTLSECQAAPIQLFALSSVFAISMVGLVGFPLHLAGCGALLALSLAVIARFQFAPGDSIQVHTIPKLPLTWSRGIALALLATSVLAAYITGLAFIAERKIVGSQILAKQLTELDASDSALARQIREQLLAELREGIAIAPHYRKLTPLIAEALAAKGDWASAAWILESTTASRPYIAAIWMGLVLNYTHLGDHAKAAQAFAKLSALKPQSDATRSLEVIVLSNSGRDEEAIALLTQYFDQGNYTLDMLEAGYAIGLKRKDYPLAIRSLDIRIRDWPALRANSYFRLGHLYALQHTQMNALALSAFKAGLDFLPPEQIEGYLGQIPAIYREQIQKSRPSGRLVSER